MLQNSPSPKCESRNPPQTICEFRKIHSPPIPFWGSRFQIEAIVLRPILYHGGELGIHSLDGRQSPCEQLAHGVPFAATMPVTLRAIVDHGVARGIPFHAWLPIALRAILAPSLAAATPT